MSTYGNLIAYRNKVNGQVGLMTAEQAALFPDLLDLVPTIVDFSTLVPLPGQTGYFYK